MHELVCLDDATVYCLSYVYSMCINPLNYPHRNSIIIIHSSALVFMKFLAFVATVAGIAQAGYAPPPLAKCSLTCPLECLKEDAMRTTSPKDISVDTICNVNTSNENTMQECLEQFTEMSKGRGESMMTNSFSMLK